MFDDPEKLAELARLLEELDRRGREQKLFGFKPYPKQLEFINKTALYRETALIAGNRVGKSLCASMQIAAHATGDYDGLAFKWNGKRFNHAVTIWVAAKQSQQVRDVAQTLLLGQPGSFGTGAIPKDAIQDVRMSRGIADSVDTILVKHKRGGISRVVFKTYDQGREAWQGAQVHVMWFDEEPPEDVYSEGFTRTAEVNGIVICTFTPLQSGGLGVYRKYTAEPAASRTFLRMSLSDADHISKEMREAMLASWAPHEREAREHGYAAQGFGAIYNVSDAVLWDYSTPQDLDFSWHRIGSIDFGTQNCGVLLGAYDRDRDCLYVYDEILLQNALPHDHAAAIRARHWHWPIAYPHDGEARGDKATGKTTATLYRDCGLRMVGPVQWPDGGNSVSFGHTVLQARMNRGGLRISRRCVRLLDQLRLQHRDDKGNAVKLHGHDELADALRYLEMGLRYAERPDRVLEKQEFGSNGNRPRYAEGLMMAGHDFFGDGRPRYTNKREEDPYSVARRRQQNVQAHMRFVRGTPESELHTVKLKEDRVHSDKIQASEYGVHFKSFRREGGFDYVGFDNLFCAKDFAQEYGGELLDV